MSQIWRSKRVVLLHIFILICTVCFANDNLYKRARALQREGKFDEAIESFEEYLSQPIRENQLSDYQVALHTDALVQLMNTFQSKGEPEGCIVALKELFNTAPALQNDFLRDYYSVLGYALSRTEKMDEAEATMLKAFTIPLHCATPERYFRDYAYAAAVFYSNPNYQKEVVEWCQEALVQAELCNNTSGKQWVLAMLGSFYKRHGLIGEALELSQQSKKEAQERGDELGVLNSLHTLVDLFIYWGVPEYADAYAEEAIRVEKNMSAQNPMISAQTYINKGRVQLHLGATDSIAYYIEKARALCQHLPYNSGMVDVNLLCGTYLTERGDESVQRGIEELECVTRQATAANRAKAYHQLAQTYLRMGKGKLAEVMLDSMHTLLIPQEYPLFVNIDYRPILEYYQKIGNRHKANQFAELMLKEQQLFKQKKLIFNLIKATVEQHTEQQRQELKIIQLKQTNQQLVFLISIIISIVTIAAIVLRLYKQKRLHQIQIQQTNDKFALLVQKLNQSNSEKEKITQEICELLNDKDKRQELETITPSMLQKGGESKFRQCFELMYPLFLPRLRERVPSITRREELLSMLVVLKQDNKEIAELLAIAPRSVLMLRHRFRQKIGLTTDNSLENFIEEILMLPNSPHKATPAEPNPPTETAK